MSDGDSHWHAEATYRSLIDYGQSMLRFTFLANGGGIISILTFVGNLSAKGSKVPNLTSALFLFVGGVILSGLATITTYAVQFVLFNEGTKQLSGKGLASHATWLYVSLVLIILSIVAFAVGSLCAVSQLQ